MAAGNFDTTADLFGARAYQIDMQQTLVQRGADDFHAIRQHETALESTGGDATMKECPFLRFFGLATGDGQFAVFNGDRQLAFIETGNGDGNANPVRAKTFDVVRRITVARRFGDALQRFFENVETQHEGRCKGAFARHEVSSREREPKAARNGTATQKR